MAYVVLVLGILAIVSAARWGIGNALKGIIGVIGLVLRGVGWLVGMLIGLCTRGGRAVVQAIAERRYVAAR